MSADREAEVLRLARALGTEPEALAPFAAAGTEELRELRMAVADHLLQRNQESYERAVAVADKVPGALAAKLAEHAMGPVLGGRAAALLTPGKAADLAGRLPAAFLADVACNVDLRRVGRLLPGIPPRTLAEAGTVLRTREEWIVLGAFVGHVDDAVLANLLGIFDGEALLRAGFVVEDTRRLDAVVALLPDARVDELLAAAHRHDLWVEAAALLDHLGPEQAARVHAALDRLPPAALDALVASGVELPHPDPTESR